MRKLAAKMTAYALSLLVLAIPFGVVGVQGVSAQEIPPITDVFSHVSTKLTTKNWKRSI